jgi:transcriptional regulator with XRE-family HTH domain
MIRTESEYKKSLERLGQDQEHIRAQRAYLESLGLSIDEVTRAMQPVLSFQAQLEEEVEAYEHLCRGELPTLYSLSEIGRWLIGVRIAKGLSQKALAQLLGVSEQQLSRDERNEYHGITIERAQKILQTMGVQYRIEEDAQSREPIPLEPLPQRSNQIESVTALAEMPPPMNVPGQVAMFLRADKNLAPDKAGRLAEMFRLAYENAASTTNASSQKALE